MGKLRVAVLMGGPSSEHDVSLATGRMVLRSLARDRYEPFPVVVPKERDPKIKIKKSETDVAFIAMHGEYGEDGTVQAMLHALGVPYTGSGVLASALAMSKPLSSRLLRDCGLIVPDFVTAGRYEFGSMPERVAADAMQKLGLPLVVKPADRGSSIGITVAHDADQLTLGIAEALRHSREAMVQCYVKGREVTCSVLEDETAPGGVRALPPTEIVPKERPFFDYYSKYTPGASEEITPPRLPAGTIRRVQEVAVRTHTIIGCSGMSRTDMIISTERAAPSAFGESTRSSAHFPSSRLGVGEDGTIYVLEINTIPGMTPTSLLPQAARASGISFPALLDKIIAAALKRAAVNR